MTAKAASGLMVVEGAPWEDILEAFIGGACDSPHTAKYYRRACATACRWLGIASLREVTVVDLAAYRGYVVHRPDLLVGSKVTTLAAMRSFMRWSGAMGAHDLDERAVRLALRGLRSRVQRPYRLLSETETRALWLAAEDPGAWALLCVTLGAGLRTSEISGLRVADCLVELEGGPGLYISQGKGRRDRSVPLRPEIFAGIVAYLEATGRTLDSPGPLFVRIRPGAWDPMVGLSPNMILKRLQSLLAAAGIDSRRVGIHGLRHMYAIGVLRHSGNMFAVQKLLGHSSVSTTVRYVDHLQLAELREALPGWLDYSTINSTHGPE